MCGVQFAFLNWLAYVCFWYPIHKSRPNIRQTMRNGVCNFFRLKLLWFFLCYLFCELVHWCFLNIPAHVLFAKLKTQKSAQYKLCIRNISNTRHTEAVYCWCCPRYIGAPLSQYIFRSFIYIFCIYACASQNASYSTYIIFQRVWKYLMRRKYIKNKLNHILCTPHTTYHHL